MQMQEQAHAKAQFLWFVFIFAIRHQQLMDCLKTLIVIVYAVAAVNVLYVYSHTQPKLRLCT